MALSQQAHIMAKDGGPLLRGGSYKAIHPEHFRDRLEALYAYWQLHNADKFDKSNVLIIETPKLYNTLRTSTSSVFHIWLFGLEFPETTIVFGTNQIHFLCKHNHHTSLFEMLVETMENLEIEISIHRMGIEHAGVLKMDEVFYRISGQSSFQNINVGCTSDCDPDGEVSLFNNWYKSRRPKFLRCTDIKQGLLELFTVKNKVERTSLRRSAELNYKVMDKYVVNIIRFIVQNRVDFSNSYLSEKIQKVILNSEMVNVSKHERVNICYPPVVQSGDKFDLKQNAVSNGDIFFRGSKSVIICGIGSSYDDLCTYLARTYLISPTPRQIAVYEILLRAQKCAIEALKPGNMVCKVYDKARYMVSLLDDELLPHLTTSAGSGIGIEFCESVSDVNPTNEMVVKTGMVFNISLGFENVIDQLAEFENTFSMLLGDTVIVEDDAPKVITRSKKSFDYVRIM